MKIWLSKNSEIPVREQIITQITLGIASGDLTVGARLPSTREIAQRFKVHSNTVSNAYQILAEQGWLEFRKGSGFYVREAKPERMENSLDRLIAKFFRTAREQGFSATEIKKRLAHFFNTQNSRQVFVIENNLGLREILIEEIGEATGLVVAGASFEDFQRTISKKEAVFAAMFDEKGKINDFLPPGKTCLFLKTRSAAASMTGERRPTSDDLIAVVSGWEDFLVLAKTMLIAARIEPESLLVRSTKGDRDWRKGLSAASMIICDSLTAKNFLNDQRVRPFRLIADDSLEELARLAESNEML